MLGVKLDSVAKKITAIIIILTAIGAIARGVYFVVEEYQSYNSLQDRISYLEKKDSLMTQEIGNINDVKKLTLRLDLIEKAITKIDSSRSFFVENFSVGYRCDKNGKKYFRSWDGATYRIYPELELQDGVRRYYYINDNGQKIYCFSE